MKKLISISLVAMLLLAVSVAFVGCGGGIVGTWELTIEGLVDQMPADEREALEEMGMDLDEPLIRMTFSRNGDLTIRAEGEDESGVWRTEDGYLFIHADDCCDDKDDCSDWQDDGISYSISNRELTFEMPGFGEITLTRR